MVRACAVLAAFFFLFNSAGAQTTYPERTIRIIQGFLPGGPPDILARLLGERFTEAWGKPVVVESVQGASGNIAADRVAKSAPDGHTLFLSANAAIAINQNLYKKMPYDSLRDLAPITQIAIQTNILTVNNDLPVKTVQELVALARSQPGKLTYASAGVGTSQHLSGEMMKLAAKIDMVHAPYRGSAGVITDLLGGHVNVHFGAAPGMLPLINDNKLRGLAVTSLKRLQMAPNLPTMDESGFPGFETFAWYGLMAPAGTSPAIIDQLHREAMKVLSTPEVRRRIELDMGLEFVGSSPTEFGEAIRREIPKWQKIIKDVGIAPID